jgi:TRAP-type C4-dicarboxylate transport system permease small subunit
MDDTPVGRLVRGLATVAAIAGGTVLVALTIITVLSIIGRALIPFGLGPVTGDFELVQAGVLFAVFVFLPWCHLERGHAIVEILTDRFPLRYSAILEFIWDVVMFVAAALIAWRHWAGLTDKIGNGESTLLLRMPLWVVYSGGMIGATLLTIVAAYCAVRSGANAFSATPTRPVTEAHE